MLPFYIVLDTGLLYIFQNGEFNNILKASPGEEHPITSLIAVLGKLFLQQNLQQYQ